MQGNTRTGLLFLLLKFCRIRISPPLIAYLDYLLAQKNRFFLHSVGLKGRRLCHPSGGFRFGLSIGSYLGFGEKAP